VGVLTRCLVLSALMVPIHVAAVEIRDTDGRAFSPFEPGPKVNVLLFIASDCPVSNGYAPEIQRICREYGSRSVACSLVYEDPAIEPAAVRTHLGEYRYKGIPAVIDRDRSVARRAHATVTPEAVVVDAKGEIRYRGRIDNRYADLGKPRRVVTVHDVRNALDAVLEGKAVNTPETTAFGCFIGWR
jgi:thiol-disulfide isomerase/thioredoxin